MKKSPRKQAQEKINVMVLNCKGRPHFIQRVLRGRLYETRFTRNKLLTCPEVAAYRGWSLRWVYELLRRGDLKAIRRGGYRLIPAGELLRLKERR